MTNQANNTMVEPELLFQAIRDSWCAETCGTPADWSSDNPAWQQCDATAFVAWEYLGGDLVLGKVFLNGQETEFHYWNRLDGVDVDLTRSQFVDGQEIQEIEVLSNRFVEANAQSMKPEVQQRTAALRSLVNERLSARVG